MDKNMESLIRKFQIIANKGFIQGVNKSTGSIGHTFEKELMKNHDNKYLPDYHDIEIKCTSNLNVYPITLFSIAFDGPTFPEINRIVDKYGYYDKTFANQKVLFANINNKIPSIVNKKYIFKLDIDYKDKRIYLCVYDIYNNLIERNSYINIDNLYNHINLKIKKIAIIYGNRINSNNNMYFKYNKICIYKLSNIEKFLKAVEEGILNAQLIVNTYKSGNRQGKLRNKNLSFQVDKNKIDIVFDKLYEYSHKKRNS